MGKVKFFFLIFTILLTTKAYCIFAEKILFTINTIKVKSYKNLNTYNLIKASFKYIDKNIKLKKQYPDYIFFFLSYFNKYDKENKKIRDKIYQKAILGVLHSISDPYADIYKNKIQSQFIDNRLNALFKSTKKGLKIISIAKDSTLNKYNIKEGDIIVSVLNKKIKSISDFERLTYKKGYYKLKLYKKGKYFTINIKINKKIKTINYKITKKNLYIKIKEFKSTTPLEFKDIINKIKLSNIEKLIIDIKDNPGGLLSSIVEFCSYFSKSKRLIFILKNKNKKYYYFTKKTNLYIEKPITILFNKNTASSSEIVLNFFSYYNLAKLKGNFSFGKKTTQSFINVFYNYQIYISTFKILNPEGKTIKNTY